MEYLTPDEVDNESSFAFLPSGWKPGVVPGGIVDIHNASMNWLPTEVEVVNLTAAYMYVGKVSDDHVANGVLFV